MGDENHFRSLSIETQKYDCSKFDPKGGQTCGAAGISWLVCSKSFFGFFCRLGASPRNLVIATFKPPAWPNHKHNNSILQCLMKTLSNLQCPHRKRYSLYCLSLLHVDWRPLGLACLRQKLLKTKTLPICIMAFSSRDNWTILSEAVKTYLADFSCKVGGKPLSEKNPLCSF